MSLKSLTVVAQFRRFGGVKTIRRLAFRIPSKAFPSFISTMHGSFFRILPTLFGLTAEQVYGEGERK
jgi:hypothetical protein